MAEDTFEMSQRELDRLKVLHEAAKGFITQREAGEQIRITERQVRRLLKKVRAAGDRGVVHALRNRHSNRRIGAEVESRAVAD